LTRVRIIQENKSEIGRFLPRADKGWVRVRRGTLRG
jgi:hypothetical protein